MIRARTLGVAVGALSTVAGLALTGPLSAAAGAATGGLVPQDVSVPHTAQYYPAAAGPNSYCTLPDGAPVNYFHCYTPAQIRNAYHVNGVAALSNGAPNYGQGQTIVLVDAYGSPTAAADLHHFYTTFFKSKGLPAPDFTEVYPLGNPQYNNTAKGNGQSGPAGAAGWSGEATLDVEWAYAIAPEAHIVLLAVPPAETEGVQGFPNLFKAISGEIAKTPPGTVFSMSFAVTEQTFGGAAAAQTAKFDQVFKQGLAKHDNFFAATGDNGTANAAKQHRESAVYPYPTAQWPATSPYVVAVGGTQLQRGWTWDPTSNNVFKTNGKVNPAYFHSTKRGNSQAVWNESWGRIGTGGGVSTIYPKPAWQSNVLPGVTGRVVPDTAWNAAVNGGVDVWITAYPQYNCGNSTGCWSVYGGTSAATPQTAALVALVNAARTSAGKAPIGFLDPILYSKLGGTKAYTDIVPQHYGSAPKTFPGTQVGVTGPVMKSVGDLVDNQMWQTPIAGYPTTTGYDATTGWGTPNAKRFVAKLAAM